jgi:hypothetical protein
VLYFVDLKVLSTILFRVVSELVIDVVLIFLAFLQFRGIFSFDVELYLFVLTSFFTCTLFLIFFI